MKSAGRIQPSKALVFKARVSAQENAQNQGGAGGGQLSEEGHEKNKVRPWTFSKGSQERRGRKNEVQTWSKAHRKQGSSGGGRTERKKKRRENFCDGSKQIGKPKKDIGRMGDDLPNSCPSAPIARNDSPRLAGGQMSGKKKKEGGGGALFFRGTRDVRNAK